MDKQCYTCKWWTCHTYQEHRWSEYTVDSADVELSCGRGHYDKCSEDLDQDDYTAALMHGPACSDWEPKCR